MTKKNDPDGINASLESFGIPYLVGNLAPLLQDHPYLAILFYGAIGLYPLHLKYKQDNLFEFVKFIQANPDAFTREIVETNAFREGFTFTFEQYLKQRTEKKRRIVQRVFLGFTASNDKDFSAVGDVP